MPNAKISVNYDTEKLAAIRQYSPEEAKRIPLELAAAIDRVFVRSVPISVRKYIESKEKSDKSANESKSTKSP